MDRNKIEELMKDTDYIFGNVQNLQGVPMTENNVSIIHNIQQLMKKVFFALKEDLDNITKAEEPEIQNEMESAEEVNEDA